MSAEKAQEFVESKLGQRVTHYKSWAHWHAFQNLKGTICVVQWDVFAQSFVLAKKVPKKVMVALDVRGG